LKLWGRFSQIYLLAFIQFLPATLQSRVSVEVGNKVSEFFLQFKYSRSRERCPRRETSRVNILHPSSRSCSSRRCIVASFHWRTAMSDRSPVFSRDSCPAQLRGYEPASTNITTAWDRRRV